MKNASLKKNSATGRQITSGPGVKAATKPKNHRVEKKITHPQTLSDLEVRYRRLFENMLNGLAYCKMIFEQGQPQDFIYLDVNTAFESLTGLKDVVGKKVSEVIPGIRETDPGLFEIYGRVALTGKPERFETYLEALQMWFSISVYSPEKEYFVAVFDVITERKRAEEALRESEDKFKYVFDYSVIGKSITLPSGEVQVNQAFADMLGYPLDEIQNLKWQEITPPEDIDMIQKMLEPLMAGEMDSIRFDKRFVHKNGEVVWTDLSTSLRRDKHGKPVYFMTNVIDITERKRADQVIKNLAKFPDENPFPILRVSEKGVLLYANNASRAVLEDWKAVIGQKVPVFWRKKVTEALVNQSKQVVDLLVGTRILSFVIVPFIETGYVNIYGYDITERKQAEEALQKAHDELELQVQQRTAALSQSNMLLQTLLDNTPDQIYFKDTESRFIKNSRAQAKALGLSDLSQVVGKTDFDFFPHAQRSYDEEQEIIRSGNPLVDYEERVVWPDGNETWVSTTKVPLRDREDKIMGTFGISRDITDRKRNEEALRKTRDELEAFSYSVSHDLRAPLRGIDGWSLALLEDYGGLLDERGQEYIRRVRSETQHMSELIDDLLQLSRINRAEMHSERVDLSALARSISARLQESEPLRRVEFIIQNGLSAFGDAHLLDVALTNLLSNAFKFTGKTPDARIELGMMNLENQRVFFVRDNGAGFDMAYAKKLFGAFQRMHKDTEFPGSGIGLATVQRIVHRHGGRVWAESAVNQGATFFFTL